MTVKRQTTLPSDVRTALGLKGGDRVRYAILENEIRIRKVRSVKKLRGVLTHPARKPVSLEAMEAAIAGGAAESVDTGG